MKYLMKVAFQNEAGNAAAAIPSLEKRCRNC